MDFLIRIFGIPLPKFDSRLRPEVDRLINELLKIGKQDDFLSERPGGPFNGDCHHRRAREIGKRLNDIGGLELMMAVRRGVKAKIGMNLASHLDYCWRDIGKWMP